MGPKGTRLAAALSAVAVASVVGVGVSGAFAQDHGGGGGHGGGHDGGGMPPAEPYNPLDPILDRGDQFVPKPAGTKETLKFYYGPYEIPPGWDANRVDLTLPVRNGMITQVEPGMRHVADGTEPGHQEAHIHHAHWFSLNPGSENDNYTYGLDRLVLRQRRRGDEGELRRALATPSRTGRSTAATWARTSRSR